MPIRRLSSILCALALAACGGGGAQAVAPPPPNAVPVVTAAGPGTVVEGTPITLLALAYDDDGDPLTYAWSVAAAPAAASVAFSTPATSVTEVVGSLVPGAYQFEVEVGDGQDFVSSIVAVVLDASASRFAPQVFVSDRQATVVGTVVTTSPRAGEPPYASPIVQTVWEGGWSGLARARDALGGYVSDEFWVVNDRGPNYSIAARVPADPPMSSAFGAGAKYFPIPGYHQKLLRLRLDHATGAAEVVSTTTIRSRAGAAVVGLPSSVAGMATAETAWSDLDDKTSGLSASADGYDFEGVVEDRTLVGTTDKRVFWTCDEYGPSVQMLDADPASADFGRVLREWIPGAVADPGAGLFALPALLRQRRDNRGFEGVAATRRAVWAMVQSHLKSSFGSSSSRLHRFVRLDKATGASTMYAYDHVIDPVALGSTHAGVKVGDLVAIGEREFLLVEHDGEAYVHLYRIRVTDATTALDEMLGGDYEKGVASYVPVEKTLVADLTATLGALRVPTKPEGLAVVDPWTVALAFDNDYGQDSDDTDVFPIDGDRARNMVVLLRLPAPLLPELVAVADYNPGIGTNNFEIPSVDATLALALVSCEGDASVQVVDLLEPTLPSWYRRDGIGAGSVTSVAAHAGRGYYLAVVRANGPGGEDVVQVRRTTDGTLLRTLDLGVGRGPDAVTIAPNGRWAVVCNEAEDPWRPGSLAVVDLGIGPFADAAMAAAGIVGVTELGLVNLVPSVGAFSSRWVDRVYNTIPPGVSATVGGFPLQLIDVNTRAQANGVPVADQTDVVFTFGATSVTGKYRLDAGGDGNTFLFQLDGSALSLEPELAAFSSDSSTCVVTLQENNAVVVLDFSLPVPAIRATTGVIGLGSVATPDADVVNSGAGAAASFDDVLVREREPDGVAVAVLGGVPCFLTVDEGDTFGSTSTESSNSRFRGGRTLSVFRLSDGQLLADTGNALDAAANASGRWGAFVEAGNRARRGGSEPENLDLVSWHGRTLAVVGLERAHALALVDVTDPSAPTVVDLAGLGGLGGAARTAPEGIRTFVADGRTFLVVGFEASGSVGVFEVR